MGTDKRTAFWGSHRAYPEWEGFPLPAASLVSTFLAGGPLFEILKLRKGIDLAPVGGNYLEVHG